MTTTPENQQPWMTYEPTKDCSLGQCSLYCPQWCSVYYFTPPPPSLFTEDTSSNATTFSPLVIALIAVLVIAFLLIGYYTVTSKYRAVFGWTHGRPGSSGSGDAGQGPTRGLDEWQEFNSEGLDESLISRIVVCKYKRGGGLVDSKDCPVCLSEFRDDEGLRLLPNCCHAFHVACIDTWLKSHSNCPLCRADIVPVNLVAAPSEGNNTSLVIEVDRRAERSEELAVSRDDESNGIEQEREMQEKVGDTKGESSSGKDDNCNDNLRQIRRSSSTEGNVMMDGTAVPDELNSRQFVLASQGRRENGVRVGTTSSEQDSRVSTSSNETLSLSRHSRGKNSALPL